jgi:hypothetical protein
MKTVNLNDRKSDLKFELFPISSNTPLNFGLISLCSEQAQVLPFGPNRPAAPASTSKDPVY